MTVTSFSASSCAVCGRPLTDVVSIACAVGPDCRATFGYDAFENLPPERRLEMRRLLHAIADDQLAGTMLRDALFRLVEFGFNKLADRIERRVWRKITPQVEIAFGTVPEPTHVLGKLDMPFALTEGQEEARLLVQRVRTAKGHSCGFVVGYAGTGKTTVLKVFAQEHGRLQIITPTGRAALRVKEATGLEASTVHRWLYKPKENDKTGAISFVRREANDIAVPPSRIILIDEASMIGPDLWKDIIAVCQQMDLKLVCVGDGFQLPPVQAPNAPPFSILTPEFAAQLGAERVELTEVLRQAQDSPIIRASMALRNGWGMRSLSELRKIAPAHLAQFVTDMQRWGGVTICHRNVTRMQLNACVRMMLGIRDEMPQKGEPFVVLKNCYEAGVVNGEALTFDGWELAPEFFERVYDKYKGIEESARFGAMRINGSTQVVLALEELHGRLGSGPRAIEIAGSKWARLNNLYSGDTLAPTVHCNFGYAWTAHKCVHPDTLVETDQGVQRIRDIADAGVISTGDSAFCYENKIVTRLRKMVTVETRDGYSVTVTPDHRLLVWNGTKYAKKQARAIQPDDYVRIRPSVTMNISGLVRLPSIVDGDVREQRFRTPQRLTNDVAELLGLIVADGTVTRKVVRLVKRHKDVVARFAYLMNKIFGLALHVRRNRGATRDTAWMSECNSTFVCRWLLMFPGLRPNQKDVPTEVLASSLKVQGRFLRGLFEDGYANTGRSKGDLIQWTNRSRPVVGTVQIMLLRFGIISNRAKHKHVTALHLFGANVKRFARAIGFVAAVKNKRISSSDEPGRTPMIPCVRTDVWEFLSGYDRSNMQMRKRAHGADTINAATAIRVARLTQSTRVRMELQDAVKWHHTRVARVTSAGTAKAMCVSVPGAERFLQNGFDGSNSQGSQWPYVLVCIEPSVRLDEEEGRRWCYTAITRAEQETALFVGKV